MGDLVVAPWILRLTLWIMLATALILVGVIVLARAARRRRERSRARALEPLREHVLQIAAGDDDGESRTLLSELPPRAFRVVAPLLVGMLSKVRGTPALAIVGILAAHGAVQLAHTGLGSPSRFRRARSAWSLGLMREEDSADEIIPLLQDKDRGVAVTAARALGMLGDPIATTALLDSLEPGPRGRGGMPVWVVVEALARLGPEAADAVGQALGSPHPTTRTAAALTVAQGQLLSQAGRIRALLESEEDPAVLSAAAQALAATGGAGDVEPLTRLTAPEHSRAVRLAAIAGLGEIGGEETIAPLLDLVHDPDPTVAEHAADSLAQLSTEAREALQQLAGAAADSPGSLAAQYGLVTAALREGGAP